MLMHIISVKFILYVTEDDTKRIHRFVSLSSKYSKILPEVGVNSLEWLVDLFFLDLTAL